MSELEKAYAQRINKIFKDYDERLAKTVREGEIQWRKLVWKFILWSIVIFICACGAGLGIFFAVMKVLSNV